MSNCENRDMVSRWWRPVGYWALTVNIAWGFPGIVVGTIIYPEAEWGIVAGVYATVLATWAAAAGIRQFGKNNGSELEKDDQ